MDTTTDTTQAAWPKKVTARIVTRFGLVFRDRNATVDIIDDRRVGSSGVATAVCRQCGWTRDHGIAYRDKVLDWARDHADQCTALTHPTT